MRIELTPPAVVHYCEQQTAPGSALSEQIIRDTLEQQPDARMLSGRVEARLLQMLVRLSRAKRVLEIGTFTGYSALCMAEMLPADGELLTLDFNEATTAQARRYFAQSPHGGKIRCLAGDAMSTLSQLDGPFDLIFLDADKERYPQYFELCLARLAEQGVLVIDNCLWSGRVLAPEATTDLAIAELNQQLSQDPRVQQVLLSVRDGIQLVMKAPALR